MSRTAQRMCLVGASALALVAGGVTPPALAYGSWTVVASPNPGESNTIGALVAVSSTAVRAIGSSSSSTYAGCHGRTLNARWNGSRFVEAATAGAPMCASVNDASGTSGSDLWGVGSTNDGRDPHLRHWDGTSWVAMAGAAIAVPPSGGRRHRSTGLNGVVSLSRSNVWAVGRAEYADFSTNVLVEHWNGHAWSLVPTPAPAGSVLQGVTALSGSDIWAVGSGGSSGTADLATLIEHWDGQGWSTVPSPNINRLNYLRGVSAVGPNDIWAVGDSVKDPFDGASTYRTLIEHWDGRRWSVVASPNIGPGNNSLAAVAVRSASDVWAVGYDDDVSGDIPVRRTLIEHWNGIDWSIVSSPSPGSGDSWLSAVVAPAGTSQVFASGTSTQGTLIEVFDP
jgi:hypothetical protein